MQDLVLLVADKNMQFAIQGALSRPEALSIRPITYSFRSHPGRDGGVRTTGAMVLAGERSRFRHALMVLDFEGSGSSASNAMALEQELDRLVQETWNSDGKAVVVDPEIDIWLWGSDNALREVFEWPLGISIRDYLRDRGFEFSIDGKPSRPKEALEALVPVHKQPRSSALYAKVTGRISLQNCVDEAFQRFRRQLQHWFAQEAPGAG